MRSLLLGALLATLPAAALPEEHPAPPPPEVRGPALPIPKAPAPEAAAPHAPEAAAPQPPTPPAGAPTLEDHAAGAVPALQPDASRAAGDDAAAAAAAVRGLTTKRPEPRREPREPSVPPSLSPRALAEELRRAAGGRSSEKEALAAERARLEKLQKEIAEARTALKVETERLAALVKAAAETPGAKAARGGVRSGSKPSGPTPVENLARTVKSMKPGQAAALLGRVDRSLAAALLERMKPAEAAAVLDQMDGATSAALVALIARKESP